MACYCCLSEAEVLSLIQNILIIISHAISINNNIISKNTKSTDTGFVTKAAIKIQQSVVSINCSVTVWSLTEGRNAQDLCGLQFACVGEV